MARQVRRRKSLVSGWALRDTSLLVLVADDHANYERLCRVPDEFILWETPSPCPLEPGLADDPSLLITLALCGSHVDPEEALSILLALTLHEPLVSLVLADCPWVSDGVLETMSACTECLGLLNADRVTRDGLLRVLDKDTRLQLCMSDDRLLESEEVRRSLLRRQPPCSGLRALPGHGNLVCDNREMWLGSARSILLMNPREPLLPLACCGCFVEHDKLSQLGRVLMAIQTWLPVAGIPALVISYAEH